MESSSVALESGLPIGAVVAGRFRVEARLGQGAMAEVYRVVDERSGRQLALKRLRGANTGASALVASQFEREYHTLCQLAHPCIVEVYDYTLAGPETCYSMELLAGQDLRERTPLPWREACAVLRDVASALAILHSRRLLHRDLSARNVRCTSAGRAKLFDFGAMTPMGMVKHVVGTPPFVPPEALQLQALDARVDLYALGALAYYVLSRRHAYPARRLDQLRELWQSAPPPLRQLVPEVPEALEQLVMQLLQLDRASRPSTAAEVMERLSGIAGLPLAERAEVTHAYLSTPALVGREAPLQQVRAELTREVEQHRGGVLLIEGAPGSGRSRFLDACVLEAKLVGAVVLRGDAADGARGDYGLARALCEQLLEAQPELARRHGRVRGGLLCHVLPEFDQAAPRRQPVPERRHLQAALRDFLLAVARRTRVVIAVDNVEAVDEPSLALLAALADSANRRELHLLLTAETHAGADSALGLIRELAQPITLAPLGAADSEALLRSVFGDAQNLAALAERAYELSLGNPRWLMALAEHLVERGIARYEAGSFSLPAQLRAADLPGSLAAALAARVAALPDDARALGEALALTDAAMVSLEDYPQLTDHRDHARTYRAIDALVSAAVIVPAGDRYRFAQRELGQLLQAGLAPERERALHARIAGAGLCEQSIQRQAHHELLGGREREAIDRLLGLRSDPGVGVSQFLLELLERASEAAERLELAQTIRLELRIWAAYLAAILGDDARFLRYGQALIDRLQRDGGLVDYQALAATLPHETRLVEALTRAQRRHDAAPEHERGFPPIEAIPQLAQLCSTFVGMAATTQDLELLERLPSLEPLLSLSPALCVVQRLVEGTRDFQAGRYDAAASAYDEVLERVERPDRAGLLPVHAKMVRLGMLFTRGVFIAARGQATALDRLAELEREPGHRVNAWRVRMTSALMQGDEETANGCRRRAELLQLQDGGQLPFPGSTGRIVLLAQVFCDDLLGVKAALELIAITAARYPRWEPTLQLARCHYLRLQGDPAAALSLIEPVLERVPPARHIDWPLLAAAHLMVLNALGRSGDAVERGLGYLAICRQERLAPGHLFVAQPLAVALAACGRLDDALGLCEETIREEEQQGTRGPRLGIQYETRARIAIAAADLPGFRRYAELCAIEYSRGRNRTLRAKHDRLLRDAEAAGLLAGSIPRRVAGSTIAPAFTESARTVHDRLAACIGTDERQLEVLRLLLEATSASSGILFGLHGGELRALAAVGTDARADGLRELLEAYLGTQLEAVEGTATLIETAITPQHDSQCWTDAAGRAFKPLLIVGKQRGEAVIAAVAALHYDGPRPLAVRSALLEALAEALLENDDLDVVTCLC